VSRDACILYASSVELLRLKAGGITGIETTVDAVEGAAAASAAASTGGGPSEAPPIRLELSSKEPHRVDEGSACSPSVEALRRMCSERHRVAADWFVETFGVERLQNRDRGVLDPTPSCLGPALSGVEDASPPSDYEISSWRPLRSSRCIRMNAPRPSPTAVVGFGLEREIPFAVLPCCVFHRLSPHRPTESGEAGELAAPRLSPGKRPSDPAGHAAVQRRSRRATTSQNGLVPPGFRQLPHDQRNVALYCCFESTSPLAYSP